MDAYNIHRSDMLIILYYNSAENRKPEKIELSLKLLDA